MKIDKPNVGGRPFVESPKIEGEIHLGDDGQKYVFVNGELRLVGGVINSDSIPIDNDSRLLQDSNVSSPELLYTRIGDNTVLTKQQKIQLQALGLLPPDDVEG